MEYQKKWRKHAYYVRLDRHLSEYVEYCKDVHGLSYQDTLVNAVKNGLMMKGVINNYKDETVVKTHHLDDFIHGREA